MTDPLSVTQIVQLIECPAQYHFDQTGGVKRSAELERRAAQGQHAHSAYEAALKTNPTPTAGDPVSNKSLIYRVLAWLRHILFGRL